MWRTFLLLPAFIFGCTFDESVDQDGDGLTLAEENELGTRDTTTDSDDDGYLDPWEVAEGTDPTDVNSVIYQGGWPYNPDKEEMEDPGWGGKLKSAEEGDSLPRFAWTDQFGDTVDIYDFAGQGVPVAVDLSGVWCPVCKELAKLIEGKDSDFKGGGWDDLGSWIEGGSFYYITVLDSDGNQDTIDPEEIEKWADKYPHPSVPVLADVDMQLSGWLKIVGYPTLFLMDENLTITLYDKDDYTRVLDELAAIK